MQHKTFYNPGFLADASEWIRSRCALVLAVSLAMAAGAAHGATTLPNLTPAPASMAFSYVVGTAKLPATQSLSLKGASNAKLSFTITKSPNVSWLVVTPASGKTPASATVSVNPTGLAVGVQQANIVITSAEAGNSPVTVPVTLTIKNPPPTVTAAPASVTFNYATDDAAFPTAQTMAIQTSGEPVSFTATTSGASWLTVAPASGITFLGSPASLKLTVDPTGLLPGTYNGKMTVATSSTATKSLPIAVTLVVTPGTAVLTNVWPPTVAVGSPDTTITITGSHLFPGSVVHVGTNDIKPTWLGLDALLAVVPSSLLVTQGALAITVTNAPRPASNAINWTVTAPGPQIWAAVNGASFRPWLVPLLVPGEIISIFGSGLGPDNAAVAPTPSIGSAYPTILGTAPQTTTVEFELTTGVWTAAPLVFAQNGQINAIVPFALTSGIGKQMRVTYNGVTSAAFSFNAAVADPGIFTVDASGMGQAAVLNYNATTTTYSMNSPSNAATKGSIICIYATGGGALSTPPTTDGEIMPITGTPATLNALTTVTIGTDTVAPAYAGVVPGSVAGLVQINATIPTTAKTGKAVPLLITIGGQTSPVGPTIAVK